MVARSWKSDQLGAYSEMLREGQEGTRSRGANSEHKPILQSSKRRAFQQRTQGNSEMGISLLDSRAGQKQRVCVEGGKQGGAKEHGGGGPASWEHAAWAFYIHCTFPYVMVKTTANVQQERGPFYFSCLSFYF